MDGLTVRMNSPCQLNICHTSVHAGKPLVVSCERTVRAEGAGRHAKMTEPDTEDQFFHEKQLR